MTYEWPYCEKCKRGVERVERRLDIISGAVLYMVYCHGEKETQVVNGLDLHDATLISTS
jgi:thioredoxin-related protein